MVIEDWFDVSLETLGVLNNATPEEIEAAYSKLKEYYADSSDATTKIYFDDLTL
jgi:DnaJ-class molecular chaperone